MTHPERSGHYRGMEVVTLFLPSVLLLLPSLFHLILVIGGGDAGPIHLPSNVFLRSVVEHGHVYGLGAAAAGVMIFIASARWSGFRQRRAVRVIKAGVLIAAVVISFVSLLDLFTIKDYMP